MVIRATSVAALLLAASCGLTAQEPAPAGAARRGVDLIPRMQTMARALGVTCEYSHTARRGGGIPEPKLPEPKKEIARRMMALTEDINTRVSVATGHAPGEGTKVDCITCHRGVALPGQLADILEKIAVEKDSDTAIEQYRDLRKRYFGRQAYDFGEDTLLSVAQKAGQPDPEDAIDLLKVNLEFNPNSVRSYSALATFYQRGYDDAAAIAALEQALRIELNNGVVQGQLLPLRNYQRRRQIMNGENTQAGSSCSSSGALNDPW